MKLDREHLLARLRAAKIKMSESSELELPPMVEIYATTQLAIAYVEMKEAGIIDAIICCGELQSESNRERARKCVQRIVELEQERNEFMRKV